MATARMFKRRNRLTHCGPPQWRYGPNLKGCYCVTCNVERVIRAGEPGSSGHGATGDAGWLAGAWDKPTHEQPQGGEQSPKARHDPGTGQGRGGLHGAWAPSSCCISSGTLAMSAPALSVSAGACWHHPSPCAGGAGLASARDLADGCSEAELLRHWGRG
jgi:hypothetical protein